LKKALWQKFQRGARKSTKFFEFKIFGKKKDNKMRKKFQVLEAVFLDLLSLKILEKSANNFIMKIFSLDEYS